MASSKSYKSALNKAWCDMLEQNINIICENSSDIKLPNQNEIVLPFLNMDHVIDFNLQKGMYRPIKSVVPKRKRRIFN